MILHDWVEREGIMTCSVCGAMILPGVPVPALCSGKKAGEIPAHQSKTAERTSLTAERVSAGKESTHLTMLGEYDLLLVQDNGS